MVYRSKIDFAEQNCGREKTASKLEERTKHTQASKWTGSLLPLALSVILPGLNFLNNYHFKTRPQVQSFGLRWLVASGFLLLLWHAIKWVRAVRFRHGWAGFAGVTLAVSAALYHVQTLMFDDRFLGAEPTIPWQQLLKLSLGALLFWLIQSSLQAQQRTFDYQLEIEQLRTENLKVQLEQLQKQLDPHFLFNSLSTLRSMVRRKEPQAEEFVLNLSDLYRQMLKTNNHLTTLEAEMETVRAYLFLVKHRYGDGLALHEQLAAGCLPKKLPFLAVQSLVENAVKHNSISDKNPLHIRIETTPDGRLSVSNNLNPKLSKPAQHGVGLANLRKRYELLGIADGLEIQHGEREYRITLQLTDG